MAETETRAGEEPRRPPAKNGSGGEDLPDDVDDLKRLVVEARRHASKVRDDNKRVAEERHKLTEALKRYNDLGDPDELAALKAERNQQEMEKAKDRGDLEKMLANARQSAEKERDAERAKRERSDSIVARVLIDDRLYQAIDKAGIDTPYRKAVFKLHRDRVKTIEDPEDEYGMRPVVEVDAEYMTIDDFLKNWVENDTEAEPFLKGSLAGGGGALSSGAGAVAKLRFKKRSQMTPSEKAAYIQAHGKDAYLKLDYK